MIISLPSPYMSTETHFFSPYCGDMEYLFWRDTHPEGHGECQFGSASLNSTVLNILWLLYYYEIEIYIPMGSVLNWKERNLLCCIKIVVVYLTFSEIRSIKMLLNWRIGVTCNMDWIKVLWFLFKGLVDKNFEEFFQLLSVDNKWGNQPTQLLANSKVSMATLNTIDLIITLLDEFKVEKCQTKGYNRGVRICDHKEGWGGEKTRITTSTD